MVEMFQNSVGSFCSIESGVPGSMNLGAVPSDDDILEAATKSLKAQHAVDGDQIVRLNIGGTKIAMLRETLCFVEGSLLENMFSGKSDGNMVRDGSGAYFIDQPIELFQPLVDFLRSKAYEDSELGPTPPPASEDFTSMRMYKQFLRLVDYYGITTCMFPVKCVSLEQDCGFKAEAKGNALYCSSIFKRVRTYIFPQEHNRTIRSFDVRIVSEGDDKFRFGWTKSADGVIVFDATRGMVYDIPSNAHRGTKDPSETEALAVDLKAGTVLTCRNAERSYKWIVEGKMVGICAAKSDYTYPCVAGQGNWVIENIQFAVC